MFTPVYTGVHRKKRNQAIFFYKILFYSCVFNELQDDTYRHMRFNTGETFTDDSMIRIRESTVRTKYIGLHRLPRFLVYPSIPE